MQQQRYFTQLPASRRQSYLPASARRDGTSERASRLLARDGTCGGHTIACNEGVRATPFPRRPASERAVVLRNLTVVRWRATKASELHHFPAGLPANVPYTAKFDGRTLACNEGVGVTPFPRRPASERAAILRNLTVVRWRATKALQLHLFPVGHSQPANVPQYFEI